MSTNAVSELTARNKFGCSGFVSPSGKEAATMLGSVQRAPQQRRRENNGEGTRS